MRLNCQKYSKQEKLKWRKEVEEMFYHAYNGYMKYAYPLDELRPLTCDGHDTWGSYSLTLIDALDTLAVMGNATEFRKVVDLIQQRNNFDEDINVSVFETNIRIVGGLLSGHLLSKRMGVNVEKDWPCKGPLLSLAEDAAKRLLPAFDTPTGMPYGTVNLRYGVPDQETSVTCSAAVATNILEFATLSRLTGNPVYEKTALRSIYALWERRSSLNLIGNHIDVLKGQWTAQDSGIGAGVDSFFEYLVKGSFMLQMPDLLYIFKEARTAIEKYLRHDDWYVWATMYKGQVSQAVFQSLEAFWPGVLALTGELEDAKRILLNYHRIWRQLGFTPEFYSIIEGQPYKKREGYPLRPELIESIMYMYQATKDDIYLDMGADIVTSIKHSTKTKCGYATIKNVNDHSLDNRMESFFLAETTKYLYLLFSDDNFIHNDGKSGTLHKVKENSCFLDTGYFFNTEAHPIDIGALSCCNQDNSIDDIVAAILKNPKTNLSKFKKKRTISTKVPQPTKKKNSQMNELKTSLMIPFLQRLKSSLSNAPRKHDGEPFDYDVYADNVTKFKSNESSNILSCDVPSFHSFYTFGGQIVVQ